MRVVEIIERPNAVELDELVAFVERVAAHAGARPLSDHLWLDLVAGGRDGFLAARVADEQATVALAQISAANDSSALEAIVRPDVADATAVRDDVVETVVDAFRRRGGAALVWWLDDPDDHDRAVAERLGLAAGRELWEMRRALPLDERADIQTRSFVVGRDEDAWLALNNRAFAGHAEQGSWTRDSLALRLGEPWFDPDGFRLHERDGRLIGFCWTKLHHEAEPVVGEIYVIAVDPDENGRGLGRQLTLAGLDAIAARGVSIANLYVDAANAAAVALYERLGFAVHRRRGAFADTVGDRAGEPMGEPDHRETRATADPDRAERPIR